MAIITRISSPWYLIMVKNMKKIHPVIMEECARTDRQTRPVPIIPDYTIAEQGIATTCTCMVVIAPKWSRLKRPI